MTLRLSPDIFTLRNCSNLEVTRASYKLIMLLFFFLILPEKNKMMITENKREKNYIIFHYKFEV
jgi:hypothetical protein